MFTSVSTRSANAYKSVGMETSVLGASSHHLVTLLFDSLQEALQRAKHGMAKGDVQVKGRAIAHAVRLLDEGLKAGLDMQRGGEIAKNLKSLYEYCILQITEANLRNNSAKLDEVALLIQRVSDGWSQIQPQASARPN